MARLITVVFLALLCAVASAVDINHPPQDGDDIHHANHEPRQSRNQNPFPVEDVKNDVIEEQGSIEPNIQVNSEDRKFFKPYFYHPYYHPLVHHPHPAPETPEIEDVDSADEQPENQELNDSVIEELDSETQDEESFDDLYRMEARKSYEVPCDFLTVPKYSCYSCYTYLVCKPEGGKVKSCSKVSAPHCNDGVCSATPSVECTLNSSALFY